MKSKCLHLCFKIIMLVGIFVLVGISGEKTIKEFGDWPFVKVGDDTIIHLIYTNDKYQGTLGYLQYNPISERIINSIPVLDTNYYGSSRPTISISSSHLLVSFMGESYPISCFSLAAISIALDGLHISVKLVLREQGTWFQTIGNIVLEDTTFGLFWVGSDGVFGQFIYASLLKEGAEFSLSDRPNACIFWGAGIDYNSINRNFITVWTDNHSGAFRLYGRIFNRDRSVWSQTLTLSDTLTTTPWDPKVLWNSDTSFTVFYKTDEQNLVCQTFNINGVALNNLRRVNPQADRLDDFAVARDNLGRMVVVWEDTLSGKILCQRFNTDASLLDTVFAVSSGVYQVPIWSLCTDFNNGKVAVVWNDADYKIWLKVFDFENPVEIEPEKVEVKPQEFRLVTNYPNPFNAATRIRFYLPQSGAVTLRVWDCRGALAKEQRYSFLPAGWQAIGFEADNLPSGIYIYELKSGREHGLGKMVLLR